MLYKSLFQLYPDNFQNNYFLLSDKLEDIRYIRTIYAKKRILNSQHYRVRVGKRSINPILRTRRLSSKQLNTTSSFTISTAPQWRVIPYQGSLRGGPCWEAEGGQV